MLFTLLSEDSASIPDSWFDAQHKLNIRNAIHRAMHEKEISVLQSFSRKEMGTEDTARAITQPISTTSIQDCGGYSDDCTALCHLWILLRNALIEWPSSHTPDLVALLSAIRTVTDPIHRGEFLNDHDDQPCPWKILPYINMIWSDAFWMTPGQILRRAKNPAAIREAHDVYFKQQDVEARLVAAGIFELKRAIRCLICTLEKTPTPEDDCIAENDGDADGQLKLSMQIPAVSKWVECIGQRLYRSVVEQQDWNPKDMPLLALQFDQPAERWVFWRERLLEVAEDGALDEFTRRTARDTAERMHNISTSSAQ